MSGYPIVGWPSQARCESAQPLSLDRYLIDQPADTLYIRVCGAVQYVEIYIVWHLNRHDDVAVFIARHTCVGIFSRILSFKRSAHGHGLYPRRSSSLLALDRHRLFQTLSQSL